MTASASVNKSEAQYSPGLGSLIVIRHGSSTFRRPEGYSTGPIHPAQHQDGYRSTEFQLRFFGGSRGGPSKPRTESAEERRLAYRG